MAPTSHLNWTPSEPCSWTSSPNCAETGFCAVSPHRWHRLWRPRQTETLFLLENLQVTQAPGRGGEGRGRQHVMAGPVKALSDRPTPRGPEDRSKDARHHARSQAPRYPRPRGGVSGAQHTPEGCRAEFCRMWLWMWTARGGAAAAPTEARTQSGRRGAAHPACGPCPRGGASETGVIQGWVLGARCPTPLSRLPRVREAPHRGTVGPQASREPRCAHPPLAHKPCQEVPRAGTISEPRS